MLSSTMKKLSTIPLGRFIYHEVRNSSEDEGSLIEKSSITTEERRPAYNGKLFLILNMLIFGVSVLIFMKSAALKPTDEQCSKQLSSWSPILEVPGLIKYESVNFALEFEQESPYRGPPTPEREKLWDELWHMRGISVPEDKLAAMNRTDFEHRTYKKVAAERGGGYAALVETFHQLHCVSMLRQHSYKEYFENKELFPGGLPEGLDGDPIMARRHLDHCIEVLRLNLMCTADVTPFLIEIDPSLQLGEKADFESNHKCRNFWEIKEWVRDNTVIY